MYSIYSSAAATRRSVAAPVFDSPSKAAVSPDYGYLQSTDQIRFVVLSESGASVPCSTCVVDGVLANKRSSYCLLLEATQLQNNAELLNL